MGNSETIRSAVEKLLRDGDGFVVFDDGDELEYVQYSMERNGLTLMWPGEGPKVPATDPGVAALLDSLGVRYAIEDDDIFAQFGTDVDLVENFTTAAFEKVYGRFGILKINARVDA